MTVNCLKCLVSCTPSCCMDEYSKVIKKEAVDQGEVMDQNDTTRTSRSYMAYVDRMTEAEQQTQRGLGEQPSPVALLIEPPTEYRKNNNASNQTEYQTARALFTRIHGNRPGPMVEHYDVEAQKINRGGAVYINIKTSESVRLPCVLSCFSAIKQLICDA